MAAPFVLSSSAVATYLRCGKQFWYAYVERRKDPPNVKLVLGRATHEAVETNFRQKLLTETDLPVEQVIDAFSDAYDREVVDVDGPDEDIGKAKDQGVAMTKLYQTKVAPTVQPDLVEEPVQFEVNGIPYSGYIDLVADNVIRDLKTTARRPPKEQAGRKHQLVGYALGYRHLTGKQEDGIQLDYLVRSKRRPTYLPVTGIADEVAIQSYAQVVTDVAEAINTGTFLPNGLIGNPPACSWCGYRNICPAFRATQR